MKRAFLILMGLLVLIAAISYGQYRQWNPAPPAAQAFINGTVLTLDAANTIAEAVLVKHDKIVLVGTAKAVMAAAPAGVLVHDLQGKTLMPGFIDAHGHFPGWGVMAAAVDLNSPPIGTVSDIADVQQRIAAKAALVDAGTWITGMGYDDTLMADMRHPTAADLDAVAPDHPVVVIHVSGHMLVANSLAMQELGIDAQTPDPDGGEIARDAQGNPTGLMKETAAEPFTQKALAFSPADQLKIIQAGVADYLAKGVTTAQNGLTNEALFAPLGWLSRLGLIPHRLTLLVEANYAHRLADDGTLFDLQSDRFHIAGVKIVTDGSIQGYTGYLTTPYHVPSPHHEADYAGYPIHNPETLNKLVLTSFQHHLKPYLHGNGDAAIDDILDAVEAGQKAMPEAKNMWPVIIHAQMMRADQIARAKVLQVSPSFFNAHVYYWGDRHKALFMGPNRAARMSPMKEALAAGLPFTTHLDTPIVPMEPWLMAWSAVTRQASSGEIIGKNQAINITQALRATTIDAAWQAGLADKTGSIEVGKWADLIVLDQSPYLAPNLREINVLETIVGGVSHYQLAD